MFNLSDHELVSLRNKIEKLNLKTNFGNSFLIFILDSFACKETFSFCIISIDDAYTTQKKNLHLSRKIA